MHEIVVFVTTASQKEAEMIGRRMVEEKLAACANILPSVSSFFSWKEKICREEEVMIILKTRAVLFEKLSQAVKQLHSYTVPEIIALPISLGSDDYLKWVRENTPLERE